jgi:hypothetical protein
VVDAVRKVVVCAEVVSPVLSAVYLIANCILEIRTVSVYLCAPCLRTVSVCLNIVKRLVLIRLPTVGCVSYEYIFVVSVILENRVNLIILGVVLVTESFNSYGSCADNIAACVILAVVVLPDNLAVSLVLD